MIELLKKFDEMNSLMVDAGIESVKKKINIPFDELLVNRGDFYEINPIYIDYLRYINLGLISSNNLKASGIDFSETNIHLDPQRVYNKDLSHSKFDDDNLVFKDLSGCLLIGTDISLDKDCYGYENAITDETTKLPERIIGEDDDYSK